MSTARSEARREAIKRRLAQCAGGDSDAKAFALATVSIWPQFSARLAPVIGARGVDILFNRALYLTSTSFPFLALAGNRGRGTAPLEAIRAQIEQQDARVAAAVSCEFLFRFTALLATLVGDSLTDRLLDPVWALTLPGSEQERDL
jgi:hypothetical protein